MFQVPYKNLSSLELQEIAACIEQEFESRKEDLRNTLQMEVDILIDRLDGFGLSLKYCRQSGEFIVE